MLSSSCRLLAQRAWRHAVSTRCSHISSAPSLATKTATRQPSADVPQPAVVVGQELELVCSRFGVERKGVCLLPPTNFVILCDRALPGERLLAKITEVKKGFATASKLQVLQVHDNAVEPVCPHFGVCGGCSYQNLEYAAQLAAKQDRVVQQVRRVGKVKDVEAVLQPIVGCEQTYGYRNKMTFTFSQEIFTPEGAAPCFEPGPDALRHGKKPRRFALGFYKPGSNKVVLPVSTCSLQSEAANEVLRVVRKVTQETMPAVYSAQSRKGVMRQCVIRQGTNPETGAAELMVFLVVGQLDLSVIRPFVEALNELPAVVSIYGIHAPLPGPPMENVKGSHPLAGKLHIIESICGLQFAISPRSFFQTNTRQAEVLYQKVAEAAGLRQGRRDVLLDLYCGTGTIGLSLAHHCKAVHGVEIVEAAVQDARANAQRNNITNATFERADLSKEKAGRALFKRVKPDVVVVDPARGGLEGNAIISLLAGSGARRLVYVSCNPSTQARDINLLCNLKHSVYRLVSLQPVDMFPQTDHVESIAVLDRVDK